MIVPIRKFVQVEEPVNDLYNKECERLRVLSVSQGIIDINKNDIIICRSNSIEQSGKFYFVDYEDIFAIDMEREDDNTKRV